MEAGNESMRAFSYKELKKATKNFRQDRVVIGDGGSVRTFYKGYINETTFAPSRTETEIAVSVFECPKDSSQALQEWMVSKICLIFTLKQFFYIWLIKYLMGKRNYEFQEKVKSQGEISHPNLVKHLGYSCEDNKSFFLVFEYLHQGSLDRHIFGS